MEPQPGTQPDYDAGDLIADKYRLVSPIGRGGMGSVWRAHNELLDVPVALKLILPEVGCEETRQRLLTEARIEAQLSHPNVVHVFDYGTTDRGDAFMVMELLEGQDLGELLHKQKQLSPTIAVQMLLPVVDALCCAHEHGVVHRDLKPDNIFLTLSRGAICPKVVDFGIASYTRLREEEERNTRDGSVLGSPSYMSPEQARGETDVDARADIWALCVVIYEAVTGGPAFNGRNYNSLLRAVIEDDVPALEERGGGEAALWDVLALGLAKDRRGRYRSMQELGHALALWLNQRGVRCDITGAALAPRWHPEEVRVDAATARIRRTPAAPPPLPPRAAPSVPPAPAAAEPAAPRLNIRSEPIEIPMFATPRVLRYVFASALCVTLVGFSSRLHERASHHRPAHVVTAAPAVAAAPAVTAAPAAVQLPVPAPQTAPAPQPVSVPAVAAPTPEVAPAPAPELVIAAKADASSVRKDVARRQAARAPYHALAERLDLKDPY